MHLPVHFVVSHFAANSTQQFGLFPSRDYVAAHLIVHGDGWDFVSRLLDVADDTDVDKPPSGLRTLISDWLDDGTGLESATLAGCTSYLAITTSPAQPHEHLDQAADTPVHIQLASISDRIHELVTIQVSKQDLFSALEDYVDQIHSRLRDQNVSQELLDRSFLDPWESVLKRVSKTRFLHQRTTSHCSVMVPPSHADVMRATVKVDERTSVLTSSEGVVSFGRVRLDAASRFDAAIDELRRTEDQKIDVNLPPAVATISRQAPTEYIAAFRDLVGDASESWLQAKYYIEVCFRSERGPHLWLACPAPPGFQEAGRTRSVEQP